MVMGIVNVTPDSFSDGGRYADTERAIAHCEQLVHQGADLLDIGAESTRPGAVPVDVAQELARLEPVVRSAVQLGVPISVDTYKPQVMRAALAWGADIINDIWAFRQPGAVQAAVEHGRCGLCVMHMHRDPSDMQVQPMDGAAVPVVHNFLQSRVQQLCAAGVQRERVAIDPGIGFGKTVEQNFSLLAQQAALLDIGCPLLVGWSRKSSLAAALGAAQEPPDAPRRVSASVAAALLAVERGAHIVRVHDVAATVAALQVRNAMQSVANFV